MTAILLHKAFITLKFRYRAKIKPIFIFWFVMIYSTLIYSQQSLDFLGNAQIFNSRFRLNSLESNPANYTLSKDWEFSAAFSGVRSKKFGSNLFSVSMSKKMDLHYFFVRYTPGYFQEFVLKTGVKIILQDNIPVETELQTKIRYDEKFGFGYSFRLSEKLSVGLSLRYFDQEFREEQPNPFFSDSINYITTKTEITSSKFWRSDFGLTYFPSNNLSVSLSSINLFLAEENSLEEISKRFSLKKNKGAAAQLNYRPTDFVGMNFSIETDASFVSGISFGTKMFGGYFSVGSAAFHDTSQKPFIAGIQPFVNFSSELFSITLSGIKYFSDRLTPKPVSEFEKNKSYNLMNNAFSYDRANLSLAVALSFLPERSVKFVDVDIKEEIYPTLADKYLYEPFAVAKIVNLTNNKITVKPASFIRNLNREIIYSPNIEIAPKDTVEISFYTVINDEKKIFRREISQVVFSLFSERSQPDDELQKPILINDLNSWDGNVFHLQYFVKRDFDFSNSFAKNIFQESKEKLENIDDHLAKFEKVKLLFDRFVKNMVYVSDRRGSAEHVQFPSETINLKGGDCDDLSVCFASLLESVGIETAFVDFKNDDGVSHVNLLINTELRPEESSLITNNDKKIFVRRNISGADQVWIPLETTSLTNFDTAWAVASDQFDKEAINELGLAKGKVAIIDIY